MLCLMIVGILGLRIEIIKIHEESAIRSVLQAVAVDIENERLDVRQWQRTGNSFAMRADVYDKMTDAWRLAGRLDVPRERSRVVDSWNRRYRISATYSKHYLEVEVRSAGRDEKFDTADDLSRKALLNRANTIRHEGGRS